MEHLTRSRFETTKTALLVFLFPRSGQIEESLSTISRLVICFVFRITSNLQHGQNFQLQRRQAQGVARDGRRWPHRHRVGQRIGILEVRSGVASGGTPKPGRILP